MSFFSLLDARQGKTIHLEWRKKKGNILEGTKKEKKNLLGFREKKIYMGFLYIKEKYQGLPLVFYVSFCFSWQSLKATFFQTVPNLCSVCLCEHRLKADTSIRLGIFFLFSRGNGQDRVV